MQLAAGMVHVDFNLGVHVIPYIVVMPYILVHVRLCASRHGPALSQD